jgi:predicted nucleic acid-binding protein
MLAVDTNIVVRLLAADDPGQTVRVRALFETQDILLLTTVLLETEWVLRRILKISNSAVCGRLRALCGLPRVTLEEPERMASALTLAMAGMDMADALHLAGSASCAAFISFDRDLAEAAAVTGWTVRAP